MQIILVCLQSSAVKKKRITFLYFLEKKFGHNWPKRFDHNWWDSKQLMTCPMWPSMSFPLTPAPNPPPPLEKTLRKNYLLEAIWHNKFTAVSRCTTWSRESKVSFIRPRELLSFEPRHLTHFPLIGKRIWVGRYSNVILTALGYPLDENAFDLSLMSFKYLNLSYMWSFECH